MNSSADAGSHLDLRARATAGAVASSTAGLTTTPLAIVGV